MFIMKRRELLQALSSASLLPITSAFASNNEPKSLQRFVSAVPFSGGWIRVAVQHFVETLGQDVIIEERFGANGLIAMRYVQEQPADRPTHLIATNSTGTLNFITRSDFGNDRRQHFKSIGILYTVPMVLITRKGAPDTLKDFLDYGLKFPTQLNYASPGIGSLPHLSSLMLEREFGMKSQHVPQTGASLVQVLGGHVDYSFVTLDSAIPYKDSDKLNLIAVTSKSRSPFMPSLPAISEFKTRYLSVAYVGLMTGRQTPDPVADLLNQQLNRMLASAEWKDKARQHGVQAFEPHSRQASEAWLDEDFKRWSRVWNQLPS
jgi:tripartite-type tricarboxylate transporter receptor subunit TctC